jgi:hypothetical protein
MARNGFETVRHVDSEVLVKEDGKTCAVCSKYRSTLRALHSKSAKTSTASTPIQTNIRYLGTPQQRRRILALKKKAKKVSMQNNRQFEKIKRLMKSSSCVEADLGLQNVLLESIRNYQEEINSLSQSDFKRLFWEQQISAMNTNGKQGVRWHPLFIRWCLNIMLSSPKTYNIMRETDMLILPSQRTLRDYSQWFKPKTGYQNEVFIQLYEDYKVSALTEAQRSVVLVIDEMKLQEGLVFLRVMQELLLVMLILEI